MATRSGVRNPNPNTNWGYLADTPRPVQNFTVGPQLRNLWLPHSNRSLATLSRTSNFNWENETIGQSGGNPWLDEDGLPTDLREGAALGENPYQMSQEGDPETGELPEWTYDPNGNPIAGNAAAQNMLDRGQSPTDGATGYAPDEEDAPQVLLPEQTGQVGSPNPETAAARREIVIEQVRRDILADREKQGLGPPTNAEKMVISNMAIARADRILNYYIGDNPDNYPSPTGDGEPAEIRAGQMYVSFGANGSIEQRPIDATTAATMNWLTANSGDIPQGADMIAAVFDPFVSEETKLQIIKQMTTSYQQYEASARTPDEVFQWGDTPIDWVRSIPRAFGHIVTDFALPTIDVIYSDWVDPSQTYMLSALPGGPRTADGMDEARTVAPGQMFAAAVPWAGASPIPRAAAAVGSIWNEDLRQPFADAGPLGLSGSPWDGIGNDIYDEEIRRTVFEDDPYGSVFSGAQGVANMLVWDPLLLLGPVAKAFKVSHYAGMGAGRIRGATDVARETNLLNMGADMIAPYELAVKTLDDARLLGDPVAVRAAEANLRTAEAAKTLALKKAPPTVRFIDWVSQPGRTIDEILRHDVIKNIGNKQDIALGLLAGRNYSDRALILRAGFGDRRALELLEVQRPQIGTKLREARIQAMVDGIVSDPDKYAKTLEKLAGDADRAAAKLDALRQKDLEGLLSGLSDDVISQTGDASRAAEAFADPRSTLFEEAMSRVERLNLKYEQVVESVRNGEIPRTAMEDAQRALDTTMDTVNDIVFGRSSAIYSPTEMRAIHEEMAQAMHRFNTALDATAGAFSRTPNEIAATRRLLDDLRATDTVYAAAEQTAMRLQGNLINFGRGRAQFAARHFEDARQTRAERKARQAATHRGGKASHLYLDWVPQTFRAGMSGVDVTVWDYVGGARRVAADALTRPFTYAAMESPAGYLRMKGVGGQESVREVQATLDNLRQYGDAALWAVSSDGTQISGQARKAQIIERYIRKLNDPNGTAYAAAIGFEKDIMYDLVRRYAAQIPDADRGLFVKHMREVYRFFDSERAAQIDQVRSSGFWKEAGTEVHRAPFLESQLVDSMPMMDFRRMETLAARWAKRFNDEDWVKTIKDRALGLTDEEAAVIGAESRLISRQRELAALREVAKAGKGGKALSTKIQRTKRNVKELQGELDKAMINRDIVDASPGFLRKSISTAGMLWDNFQILWRASVLFRVGYPVRNTIDGITRRLAYESSIMPVIRDTIEGSKNFGKNFVDGKGLGSTPRTRAARAAGLGRQWDRSGVMPRQIRRWKAREGARARSRLEYEVQYRERLRKVLNDLEAERPTVSQADLAEFDSKMDAIALGIRGSDLSIEQMRIAARPFSETASMSETMLAFRQSLDRPRRIGDKMLEIDGNQYFGMTGDPRMGGIMQDAVSARETVEATAALRLSTSRSVVRASMLTHGGLVSPADTNYFNELAQVLNRQVKNSILGRGWMLGIPEDEMARILMNPTGARYQEFVRVTRQGERTRGKREAAKAADDAAADDAARATLDAVKKAEDDFAAIQREIAEVQASIASPSTGQVIADAAQQKKIRSLQKRLDDAEKKVEELRTAADDAAVAAPSPSAATTTPSPASRDLPRELSGAKPRFGFGASQYQLDFPDGVTKALYIVRDSAKRSKSDGKYMDWLRQQFPDATDAQIRGWGDDVKAAIRGQVDANRDAGSISVPAWANDAPSPAAAPTPTPKPKKGKDPVAQAQKKVDELREELQSAREAARQSTPKTGREKLPSLQDRLEKAETDLWKAKAKADDATKARDAQRELSIADLYQLETMEDALAHVQLAYREFGRYAPNEKIREALARGEVSEQLLRELLDGYGDVLVSVHGKEMSRLAGSADEMTAWDRVTSYLDVGYQYIGTIPEDVLVRVPFANARYNQNMRTAIKVLGEQFGDEGIPPWAVDQAYRQARSRAVKDTKDYMYTQDRRTNFGRVWERWSPFISAWQNSVMAMTKLVKANPEILYYANLSWQVPEAIGMQDSDGNLRIPIPEWAAPLGLSGGDDWVYDKGSAFVFPYMIDPMNTKPGPLVQATASALFQKGLISAVRPAWMASLFGEEAAATIHDATLKAIMGVDNKMSDEGLDTQRFGILPWGMDKILPPDALKFAEVWIAGFGNTPENNSTYAYHYNRTLGEEQIRVMRGERENDITREEIIDRVNATYLIRMLTNRFGVTGGPLGAITPNKIDSEFVALVEAGRLIQDVVGPSGDGAAATIDLFGDEAYAILTRRTSRSNAGVPASQGVMIRAERNEDMLREIAPRMADPRMISFMLTDGSYSEEDYDALVRQEQFFRDIPGMSEPYRETMTPQESLKASLVGTGWALYDQSIGALDAELQARGLASWESAEAKDLKLQRDRFIEFMENDTMYRPWWEDLRNGAPDRLESAILMIRSLTNDPTFMEKDGSNPRDMWVAATAWVDAREAWYQQYDAAQGNERITQELNRRWAAESNLIASESPRFRQFWLRYLQNDNLNIR